MPKVSGSERGKSKGVQGVAGVQEEVGGGRHGDDHVETRNGCGERMRLKGLMRRANGNQTQKSYRFHAHAVAACALPQCRPFAHSPIRPFAASSPPWLLNCLEHLYEFLIAVEEIEGDKGHRLRL